GPPSLPTPSGGSANTRSCNGRARPSGGAPAPLAKLGTSPVCMWYCWASALRSAFGSCSLLCSCSWMSPKRSVARADLEGLAFGGLDLLELDDVVAELR